MISDSEPLLTDHRESFFDPALFVHLFHNGEFRSEADKKSYTWIVEQVHSIFKNGFVTFNTITNTEICKQVSFIGPLSKPNKSNNINENIPVSQWFSL